MRDLFPDSAENVFPRTAITAAVLKIDAGESPRAFQASRKHRDIGLRQCEFQTRFSRRIRFAAKLQLEIPASALDQQRNRATTSVRRENTGVFIDFSERRQAIQIRPFRQIQVQRFFPGIQVFKAANEHSGTVSPAFKVARCRSNHTMRKLLLRQHRKIECQLKRALNILECTQQNVSAARSKILSGNIRPRNFQKCGFLGTFFRRSNRNGLIARNENFALLARDVNQANSGKIGRTNRCSRSVYRNLKTDSQRKRPLSRRPKRNRQQAVFFAWRQKQIGVFNLKKLGALRQRETQFVNGFRPRIATDDGISANGFPPDSVNGRYIPMERRDHLFDANLCRPNAAAHTENLLRKSASRLRIKLRRHLGKSVQLRRNQAHIFCARKADEAANKACTRETQAPQKAIGVRRCRFLADGHTDLLLAGQRFGENDFQVSEPVHSLFREFVACE